MTREPSRADRIREALSHEENPSLTEAGRRASALLNPVVPLSAVPDSPEPALPEDAATALAWLRTRVAESVESYNAALTKYGNNPVLRDLRWAIGHAAVASEITAPFAAQAAVADARGSLDRLDSMVLREAIHRFLRAYDTAPGFDLSAAAERLRDDLGELELANRSTR